MKISKEQQKLLIQQIKQSAKNEGLKTVSNSLYQVINDNFIHADYLIVESKKLVFRIYVKKYIYDNIFWNIINMKDNLKKKDSLRATGAFKAPSLLIKSGKYELTDNVNDLVKQFIDEMKNVSSSFIISNEITDYVAWHDEIQDKTLKCLAYIDARQYSSAMKIAKKEIESGNRGGVENEGKGFFEWLLYYLNGN